MSKGVLVLDLKTKSLVVNLAIVCLFVSRSDSDCEIFRFLLLLFLLLKLLLAFTVRLLLVVTLVVGLLRMDPSRTAFFETTSTVD